MIEEEIMYDFNDKKGLLNKLQGYAAYPDDDNIRLKEKIKSALLHCPELLYVLNNKKLESELFDNEGLLLTDGEWDRYFGSSSNIRPFLFLPPPFFPRWPLPQHGAALSYFQFLLLTAGQI